MIHKRVAVNPTFIEKFKTILIIFLSIFLTLASLLRPYSHLTLYQRINQLLMKYMATYSSYKSLRYIFNLVNPLQRFLNRVDIVENRFGEFIGSRTGSGYVLVYFHGGGYTVGNPTQNLTCCKDWLESKKIDCVFSVDYPLAPESVYPEQIEFGKAAVSWLCEQGVEMDRMIFVGDSAGGHAVVNALVSIVKDLVSMSSASLAKATDVLPSKGKRLTHLVKNRALSPSRKSTENLPEPRSLGLPRAVVLISPWVDPTASEQESKRFYHDEDYLTPEILVGFRDTAFPDPITWSNENVNLFLLEDKTVFKIFSQVPVMIAFGGIELLSNQAIRFGNKINRVLEEGMSPLQVKFDVDPDMPHVYQAFGSMHFGKNARMGNARILEWIESI